MIRDDFWIKMKNIQRVHRILYTIGLGPIVGKLILLLTTTGRKSGQKRITPLQYEVIEGKYFIGSARGKKADWYRNIQADGRVEVWVKDRRFRGMADTVTDPARIVDFLETRLHRHPFMMGLLMQRAHGLPKHPSREMLLELAASEAMVIIQPVEEL
jgi:deazaflavin-dependent oxidoreductase (nitroreductase family)